MYTYAFTLRRNANPVWIVHYDDHMTKLKDKYKDIEIDYHFEPEHGLHIHGMIRSPKTIHIRQIHPGAGWNLDFGRVRSELAWTIYTSKHRSHETTLINDEYRLYNEYVDYQRTLADHDYPDDHDPDPEYYKTINLFTLKPIPQSV